MIWQWYPYSHAGFGYPWSRKYAGAEQSGLHCRFGFMKLIREILAEAVKELKEDEFAGSLCRGVAGSGEEKISGENFVDECRCGK